MDTAEVCDPCAALPVALSCKFSPTSNHGTKVPTVSLGMCKSNTRGDEAQQGHTAQAGSSLTTCILQNPWELTVLPGEQDSDTCSGQRKGMAPLQDTHEGCL